MIEILPNQHQLSFPLTFPFLIINTEALTAQVEDVTPRTFIKPQNPLRTEDTGGQLIIQEILKLPDR